MRNKFFQGLALSGLLVLIGCESPDAATEPAVEEVSFEVVKPAAYDGDFNPDGLDVAAEVGKLAPEISGVDLDGVPFKLSDYRGKVVMLDFYGDW